MAEVFLGLHEGIGGFQKLVVMKRLSGLQSEDHEAVDRLLAEARIAATINHPNVVSTLDLGRDRGAPFIVLEYLAGEDLRYILNELRERGGSMPLPLVCRIGASIASALSLAHELPRSDGSTKCIVHRDVTPSNVIVCYSGVSKLVDFGVARVVGDVPQTKAGTVKGKFSYLAPEQLTGDPIDGRTDIFQLGIVLWEMVTTSRLFDGKSDHERLHAIIHREVPPPSQINPAIPPGLERTILRALERDPKERHQAAHELESELEDALISLGESGGDRSVGEWMHETFSERYGWRQELERRTLEELEDEADLEVELEIDPPQSGSHHLATGSSLAGLAIERSREAAPARGVGGKLTLAIAVLGVVAAMVWWRGGQPGVHGRDEPGQTNFAAGQAAQVPEDYEVDLRVIPPHASITVDGELVARGRYRGTFAADGEPHTVTFAAPDHATVQRRFRGATTIDVQLEAIVGAAPPTAEPGAAEAPATGQAASDLGPQGDEAGEGDARASRGAVGQGRRSDRAPASTRPRRTAGPESGTAGGARARSDELDQDAGKAAPKPDASPPARPRDDFAPVSDNLDPFS